LDGDSARPLLSATLIVRDEGRALPACLRSLQGLADEIVVVDTGSVDRSVEIAVEHGARVFHHEWGEDFSAARNLALDHARGEWILYIDADERVRSPDREALERRLETAPELALRVLLRPYVDSTPFYEHRLWRADPRIRFRGVIHEQVVDAIYRVAAEDRRPVAMWSGLVLDHVGYEGDQRTKHERNLPLLRRQLALDPSNMFNWRHLARVLVGLGDEDGAEEALQRAVALARSGIVSPLTAMTGSLAWADLVTLRHQRGDDVTGLLAEGRARWPEQWQLVWIEGQIHLDRGRLEQAAACFRALLEVDLDTLPEAGVSYDQRVFGVFAQSSLGLTLFRMGRYAEAAEAYAAAERLEPDEREHTAKRILAERRAASRIAQAR
jgi:tetratricopeptide (TPR) repeat protein